MEQKTYVRISDETHPMSKNAEKFFSKLNSPNDEDYKIVDEILGVNKKIGNIDMGGAWKYYNENTRKIYVNALYQSNRDELANLYTNLFQNCCSSGLMTPSINVAKDSNLSSQMFWDLDALVEFSTMKYDETILNTPDVGAPFGIINNGNKILPDSPRHLHFAQKLMGLNPNENILEIGGGYGGLIYFLQKLGFNSSYFNIDLPETLFVCYYYLRKNKIKCEFLLEKTEIKKGIIYLIPSMLFQNITETLDFNTFFNSASLSEMDQKICDNYIKMVVSKKPKYILHGNSNFLAFPNSKIHLEVLGKDFKIPPALYKLVYQQISPFQGASGRYREFLYELK